MPPFTTISSLLLHQAKEHGDKVAFSSHDRTVTYRDLEKRTGHIASSILASLSRQGSSCSHYCCVAILLSRRLEAIESVLAIPRAGAVAVPLDPRASPSDLGATLRHCGAQAIITEQRYLDKVRSATTATVIVVDIAPAKELHCGNWAVIQGEEVAEAGGVAVLDTDDTPAFLHYTSGTTGAPKGILSHQASWLWSAAHLVSTFGLTSADALFWPLPLFHCLGHSLCILSTLTAGASAHLAAPDTPLLQSLPTDTTLIVGAPATFYELLSESQLTRASLPRLRACMSAGAPAPDTLRARVREVFGAPLVNNYGCTEACGAIAIQTPNDVDNDDVAVSGVPLQGIEVRLVDVVFGDPVYEDEKEGEVWVRGPSLMLGYYCREDAENHGSQPLSASSFEKDGWFRTGDMACWVRSSNNGKEAMRLVGRRKELIIRGGENIYPEELERVLLQCPGVADVVVTGAPHPLLGETPAAFLVRESEDCALDPRALLAACREQLGDHKTPTALYEIDAVPRTLLGKPRRAEVARNTTSTRRPLTARASLTSKTCVAALVEAEVAGACGQQQHAAGAGDRPFSFWGLTSMAGVVLRDRLCSLTGLELPTTLVFEYPTPDALVEYLCHRLLLLAPACPSPPAPAPAPSASRDDAEPIAIVSMACRYPGGVKSPDDLWRIVVQGLDVTSGFPTNRGWDLDALYNPDPDAPGTSTTQRGAFLHDMADFDAGLFGMAPREAIATDPQQRLLLETTWDLLERGRMAPTSLRGSQTGVFVGSLYDDYEENGHHQADSDLEAHLTLGSSGSVVTGRISYCFGLHGPSICVQTGCSSSLVAIHLAAMSLRTNECSLAVAGGVTTMATPRPFIFFSKRRGLSPDGRCRAYSSGADGTGWGEGVGLLLLERLSDAQRNGHAVLGVLRGSAVNSDGAASNGLTAPSGMAQQAVIKQALAQAGVQASDVDVVEGHGTATPLGDPIEVNALIAAYGGSPVLLGSIKSNIGHTQAAAGVAGIIKMVQAMRHGLAPATLHVNEPSRQIHWAGSGVELLTESRPWPQSGDGRPKRAAVSSFGIGGTNAHVILEEAPPTPPVPPPPPPPLSLHDSCAFSSSPWLLSGADEVALRAQAKALLLLLPLAETGPADSVNIAVSLATTRSALQHRAMVLPPYQPALTALTQGQPLHPGLVVGASAAKRRRVAFLFSGQGGSSRAAAAMGQGLQELRTAYPVFASAFQTACDALDRHLECPLETALVQNPLLLATRTDFAQAALFAFQVALFRLLASTFRVCPDAVAGHSLGEIAAAHTAGYLSLDEAALIVATRGKLMAALPEDDDDESSGSMVSIAASQDDITRELAAAGSSLSLHIAAINSSNSLVVSGTTAHVTAIAERFRCLGRRVKVLPNVRHAFHSPLMTPILADLEHVLMSSSLRRSATATTTTIPLVSTVTGTCITASAIRSPHHWVQHVRKPVRFADAVHTLQQDHDATVFLEIGPSAVLGPHVSGDVVATTGHTVASLLAALGCLWAQGGVSSVDWQAVFQGSGARLVDLPVYAFQKRRYWLDPPIPQPRSSSSGLLTMTPSSSSSSSLCGPLSKESLPAKLASVSADGRRTMLLDLICAQVAAVLGFQDQHDVPKQRPFAELGFDSFTSALLTNRLRAATGVKSLPVTLALDCDDLHAMAQYLDARLDDNASSGIADAQREAVVLDVFKGLPALHKRLCQLGQYTAAAALLASAAGAFPTFTFAAGGSLPPSIGAVAPQRLTARRPLPGVPPTRPLVCIAPFFPPIILEKGSSSAYRFLAAAMHDARDVFELRHPEGAALPADLATLAAVHATTIRTYFGEDAPLILAGYSAGGVVAHAVAAELGTKLVAGLVLIDTYPNMRHNAPNWLHALPGEALVARGDGSLFDGTALAKMGGYFRLLQREEEEEEEEEAATENQTKTLFLRATQPSPLMPHDGWRASFPGTDRVVEVPGSHLELLDQQHAPAVAVQIERWLTGLVREAV